MSSILVVKCVRCGSEAGFGDYAASPGAPSKEEFVEQIVGQFGWRKTFAGWQCPNHKPAGHAPLPKSMSGHPDAARTQGLAAKATWTTHI
jgi:hypothetical protein